MPKPMTVKGVKYELVGSRFLTCVGCAFYKRGATPSCECPKRRLLDCCQTPMIWKRADE